MCYATLILSIVTAASTLLLHQASNHLPHAGGLQASKSPEIVGALLEQADKWSAGIVVVDLLSFTADGSHSGGAAVDFGFVRRSVLNQRKLQLCIRAWRISLRRFSPPTFLCSFRVVSVCVSRFILKSVVFSVVANS